MKEFSKITGLVLGGLVLAIREALARTKQNTTSQH